MLEPVFEVAEKTEQKESGVANARLFRNGEEEMNRAVVCSSDTKEKME